MRLQLYPFSEYDILEMSITKHSDALLDNLLWSQYPCGQSDLIIPPLLSYTR